MKNLTRVVDLEFAVARFEQPCQDDSWHETESEHFPRLTIFTPAKEGSPAQSVNVWGKENVKVLKEACELALYDYEIRENARRLENGN